MAGLDPAIHGALASFVGPFQINDIYQLLID
jgi:hypothetical protein